MNRLYNPALFNQTLQQKGTGPSQNSYHSGAQLGGIGDASKLWNSGLERQWTIKVVVQRFAYPGSFVIDFFTGSPPTSTSAWPTAANLVGSHAQFIAATASEIIHPDESSDTLSHGEVPLTPHLSALVREGLIADLEPDSVTPFLTKSLNWRARDMKGCELELDSLAALSIAVGSQAMRTPKLLNQFPLYGGLEINESITAGKPGGLGQQQSS